MGQGALIGIVVTILLIICGFFLRRNPLLLCIQVAWILILAIYNTDSMDFKGNSELYYLSNSNSLFSDHFFGSAFYFFSTIAKRTGMDYLTFNGILVIISTIIILYVVIRLSSNPCLVISFFMCYPLVSSIIQKRWYFAMGILIIGVFSLFSNKNKVEKTIILLGCVTFACMFHAGAVYFYTLAIYYWIPDKYKRMVSIIGFVVLTLGKNNVASLLSSSTNSDLSSKSDFYLGTLASDNLGHYLFWILWQLLFVCIILYLINKNKILENSGSNYSNTLWIINWWSILIIPLYSFDPVFTRLFRVVLLFDYIAISNLFIIKNYKIGKINLYSNIYQFGLCIATFFIFNALAGAPIDELVYPIFENNVVLNMLN